LETIYAVRVAGVRKSRTFGVNISPLRTVATSKYASQKAPETGSQSENITSRK
jgi:hypothetical protein